MRCCDVTFTFGFLFQGEAGNSSPRSSSVRVSDVKLKFESSEKHKSDDVTSKDKEESKKEEVEEESETIASDESKAKPKAGSRAREESNIFVPAVGTLPHQPKSDRHAPPQNISVKKSAAPAPPSNSSQNTGSNTTLPSNSGDAKPQAIVKPTPQKPPPQPDQQQMNNNSNSVSHIRDDDVIKMESEKQRVASESGSLDSTPSGGDRSSTATASTIPAGGTLSDLKRQRSQMLQEKLSNSLRFKDTDQLNAQLQQLQLEHDEAQARNGRTSNGSDASRVHTDAVGGGSGSARRYKFTQSTVVGESDDSGGCCVVQ